MWCCLIIVLNVITEVVVYLKAASNYWNETLAASGGPVANIGYILKLK